MSRRTEGRALHLPDHRRLAAATELGEAIAKLRVQVRTDGGTPNEPGSYGTDLAPVLGCIASALQSLGFDAEASPGGFGRAPTLVVTDGTTYNTFLRATEPKGVK